MAGAGRVPAQEPTRPQACHARTAGHAAQELHTGHHNCDVAGGEGGDGGDRPSQL